MATLTTTGFLTPDIIAKEAVVQLYANAVTAQTVNRNYSGEFNGKVGDTITVRKPTTFTAKEFSGEIETQAVSESGVAVKLDTLLDVSVPVTTEDLSLNIADFSAQIIQPAMQAFVQAIDAKIIAAAKAAATSVSLVSGDYKTSFVNARKVLQDAFAPLTDRSFICGTGIEAGLLGTDLLIAANTRGDSGAAINNAQLGTIFGIKTYCDQNMDEDGALCYHKDGIALVTRTPELPLGAANAATSSFGGFGIRVVQGYDMKTKTDTISFDLLCGVAILNEKVIALLA